MDPLHKEAVDRLASLVEQAREAGVYEPTAMTLATADAKGRPSARVVLMRGLDERGIVFYTNLESRKGVELAENPHAAVCFWWRALGVQVRVEGPVEQVDDAEADAYWRSRPRESRLGAWASDQSRPLDDFGTLETRVEEMAQRFPGEEVPRPAHWSGLRLRARRFEFWENQPARLHHRVVYEEADGAWRRGLLYP